MPDRRHDLQPVRAEFVSFLSNFRSVVLSTISAEGEPEASYAPFVRDDGVSFYIYVSGLSAHTANLKANGRASLLFIEDERIASNLFARERVTLRCSAQAVARGDDEWISILDEFAERFGELVAVLRDLQDFVLFRLTPEHGSYVRGFGQAYRVAKDDLIPA